METRLNHHPWKPPPERSVAPNRIRDARVGCRPYAARRCRARPPTSSREATRRRARTSTSRFPQHTFDSRRSIVCARTCVRSSNDGPPVASLPARDAATCPVPWPCGLLSAVASQIRRVLDLLDEPGGVRLRRGGPPAPPLSERMVAVAVASNHRALGRLRRARVPSRRRADDGASRRHAVPCGCCDATVVSSIRPDCVVSPGGFVRVCVERAVAGGFIDRHHHRS